jgi:hypothetical protein
MAHSARFWTYRAGTPVRSPRGQLVGHVAAVRPEAVLVVSELGDERWFAAGEISGYGPDGLTVAVSPGAEWSPPPMGRERPGDDLESAPLSHPPLPDSRFDA